MYCDLWSQYMQVLKLFKGGNYSRTETICGNMERNSYLRYRKSDVFCLFFCQNFEGQLHDPHSISWVPPALHLQKCSWVYDRYNQFNLHRKYFKRQKKYWITKLISFTKFNQNTKVAVTFNSYHLSKYLDLGEHSCIKVFICKNN